MCQRVLQNLSFSGAREIWLVLEMLPEVDLSFRPRVPEFMVTWVSLTTQQIADFKDQLSNRARTKDLKGNEQ